MKTDYYKLMFVTNRGGRPLDEYLYFVKRCIDAGVTSVQLREKEMTFDELKEFAISIKKLTDEKGIPLIINDSIELCHEVDAGGLHLGQTDGNPINARKLLGPQKLIGISTNNLEQVSLANALPIDYIGVGAIFHTKNKPNVEKIWGLQELSEACALSEHKVVAIGGIDTSNINEVMATGSSGIAAIGAFHDAAAPEEVIRKLLEVIDD